MLPWVRQRRQRLGLAALVLALRSAPLPAPFSSVHAALVPGGCARGESGAVVRRRTGRPRGRSRRETSRTR